MSVIERAEQRLQEEIRQNHLGADNWHNIRYWAAYLDGARAQADEVPVREKGGRGMSYDKLIEELRDTHIEDRYKRLTLDAAAAIEALQAELERKRTADCFWCKCEKMEVQDG